MRDLARTLLVAAQIGAVVAMFIPVPVLAAPNSAGAHHCCADMQQSATGDSDCPMHKQQQAPAKQQQNDSSCCQLCAAGIALLYSSPAPFVDAQTGEESLTIPNARGHSLPHRPPVPPPRLGLA